MRTPSNHRPAWYEDVIEEFRDRHARSPKHIAELTHRLADSGVVLAADRSAADVASTGGPASLTTFIAPLVLATRGVRVPKIGVAGRPAGVIDSLGVIPGYKTTLSAIEFREALRESGFGNTLAAGVFAPDDGILFSARQRLGAQNAPALVIASLLSKKLAAGLTRVVFDIRTMRGGNFGANPLEARSNIELLQQTAALIGIEACCIVTDGDVPQQPMIGRAEALRGLRSVLEGKASPWLERHFGTCLELANFADRKTAGKVSSREDMLGALNQHLRAQGADGYPAINEYLDQVASSHPTEQIYARRSGRLYWDMPALRSVVVKYQGQTRKTDADQFPDECGVELLRETDEIVEAGDPVAVARGIDRETLLEVVKGLRPTLHLSKREHSTNESEGPT